MSFDATNPEHHKHFTQVVLKALTDSWLGNAWTHKMSTEGRRINDREEQNIRDRAKQELSDWMAQIWQDGHDTALINGQSQNPHDKDAK